MALEALEDWYQGAGLHQRKLLVSQPQVFLDKTEGWPEISNMPLLSPVPILPLSLSNETEWWTCSGGGIWRGRRVCLLGREEVIATGLCLAMTLAGSDCVGPLGGQTLKEQKAG